MPALHDSAEHGDLAEVRRLLEAGTSVNQLDDSDETALHGAAFGSYFCRRPMRFVAP